MELRKLNYTQADTFDIWLSHNGYDLNNMTLKSTIRAAREMSAWFSGLFVYYEPIVLVAGILALQNGGEV